MCSSLSADKRSVLVNMRTHVPERLLQIGTETRTVLATNKDKFLKVYLYFTEPVMNSSTEILNSIDISQGSLIPIDGSSRGQRRFGYQVHFSSSQDELYFVRTLLKFPFDFLAAH